MGALSAARAIPRQEFRHFDFNFLDRDAGGVGTRWRSGARPSDGRSSTVAVSENSTMGAYRITLEVWLRSADMDATGASERERLFDAQYWSLGQMIAHHTSNGCPIRAGRLDWQRHGIRSRESTTAAACWNSTITRQGEADRTRRRQAAEVSCKTATKSFCAGGASSPGFRRIGLGEWRGVVTPANTKTV